MSDTVNTLSNLGVIYTLRWLHNFPPDWKDEIVVRRSVAFGLLDLKGGEHWSVSTGYLAQTLKNRRRALPKEPDKCALILSGLGEMAARSHTDCVSLICSLLRGRTYRQHLKLILENAARLSKINCPKVTLKEMAAGQTVQKTRLDWNGLHDAFLALAYSYEKATRWRYGLNFAACVAFRAAPREVSCWLGGWSDDVLLASIRDVAVSMLSHNPNFQIQKELLAGKNDLLKCLAVASVINPWEWGGKIALNISEALDRLEALDVGRGDAIWMSGLRLKELFHCRFRLEDCILGGTHEEALSQQQEMDKALEDALAAIQEYWPREGLSEEQLSYFNACFFDTKEYRHRVAEIVPHKGNCHKLLDYNIDCFMEELVGSKNSTAIPDKYYYLDRARTSDEIQWVAKSLILRWDDDDKGVGRRFGARVQAFVDMVNDIIEEPFGSYRWPARWRSAQVRLSVVHVLFMTIAHYLPRERWDEVSGILPDIVGHIRHLLVCTQEDWRLPDLNFRNHLTMSTIQLLQSEPTLSHLVKDWSDDKRLPDFARAYAVWSIHTLISLDVDFAKRMFETMGKPPFNQNLLYARFEVFMNLMDLALSVAMTNKDEELCDFVISNWEKSLSSWPSFVAAKWQGSARRIHAAMVGSEQDKEALLQDEAFSQSLCSDLVRNLVFK